MLHSDKLERRPISHKTPISSITSTIMVWLLIVSPSIRPTSSQIIERRRFKSAHFISKRMVLGTCVVHLPEGRQQLAPHSISIEGVQSGFIVSFTVKQAFTHSHGGAKEMSYIVPNNSKLCMYDTTFRIGSEVIKPKIHEKKQAEAIYLEAKKSGHAALIASNLGNGLVEFKLGNIGPGVQCQVECRCAVAGSSVGPDGIFVKFPLDCCTPSGSVHCVTTLLRGKFNFSLRNTSPGEVSKIECNEGGTYEAGSLTLNNKPSGAALLITTRLNHPLKSEFVASKNACAVTLITQAPPNAPSVCSEFVFLVDCSGSMSGLRIEQARQCLTLFIRSLPQNSFFNIIRFGSGSDKLFGKPVPYNPSNGEKALKFAKTMQADLGGTEIWGPLNEIYKTPPKKGIRSVFVLTDGEIDDTDQVRIEASKNSKTHRCFCIGLGCGADAGLVEGLADATGGRSDFVRDGQNLSGTVISQLAVSMRPALTDLDVHFETTQSFKIAPFPIKPLPENVSNTIFISGAGDPGKQLLASGKCNGASVDLVCMRRSDNGVESSLQALFAYERIQQLMETLASNGGSADRIRTECVGLSIASGVLCDYTSFVGVSEKIYYPSPEADCECDFDGEPRRQENRERAFGSGRMHYARWPGARAVGLRSAGKCCFSEAAKIRYLRETPPEPSPMQNGLLGSITDLQSLQGFWSDLAGIAKVIGVAEVQIWADIEKHANASSIFASVLAIAALRTLLAVERSSWMLIEQKCLAWLASQGVNAEELISRAVALIP
jgi:hypothetical protein